MSRDPIEEDGGFNLYSYVRNSPINAADVLGYEGRYCGSDGWKRFSEDLKTETQTHTACTVENLMKSSNEARRIFREYEWKYRCCYEEQEVLIRSYPDPGDGDVTSHGVLHRLTGCLLAKAGFSHGCMTDANVGHEVSTIKGEWLDRSDRNFFDWLRDTYLDMKDIVYGYKDGLNVTGPCEGRYVPGDCCLRSSPCCRCRLMYGR